MAPVSEVWKHFIKKNTELASCKRCNNSVKYCGNTSNLHKHLRSHNITVEKCNKLSKRKMKEQEEIETVDLEADTDEISAVVTESNSQTIETAFQSIISHKEGGKRQNKIAMCILFFICKDMRPFNIVEGEGFLKLMKELSPLYVVPSSVHFKKMLGEKYEVMAEASKKRIKLAPTVCLTIDIWTETMAERSFLGVTVHFLEGIKMVNYAIATRQLYDRHTARNIAEVLKNILDWEISISKVKCIISDNGRNMVAAIKELVSEENHFPCFAHTVNLVVHTGLEDSNIAIIVRKVRKIVLWVKNSVINSDKLRKKQMDAGVAEGSVLKLIQDVNTRWNSVYYMVERFLELSTIVSQMLLENCLSPGMVTAQELEILKQLMVLLEPFEYLTKEASAENYITLSKIIPMVNCLKTTIGNFTSQFSQIRKIADIFRLELNNKFGDIENNSFAAMATILDPRFKNINFQDSFACSQVIQKLRNAVRENPENSSSESDIEISPTKKLDFWKHHKDLVIGNKRRKTSLSANDEVSLYLSSPISNLKSNPLEEWEDMQNTFPKLYKLARIHLSIVASSVPCERLFSKAGFTISNTRTRLSGKNVEKLLFLGNVTKKEFFS